MCSFDNLHTPEGVKPDLKEVETSKQMQTSINKQQLSSILSMVNYLFYYMPNISYLTSDLWGLLKKEALFQWSEAHDVTFKKIKNHVSQNVCDGYLNTTEDVLYVDVF